MKIEINSRGSFQVLKIFEEIAVIADLSELKFIIEGYLKQGRFHIAVGFVNASYIYSGAIAVLIELYKRIHRDGGQLCIVESNPEILNIFRYLSVDRLIPTYPSVDDIPGIDDESDVQVMPSRTGQDHAQPLH